MPTIKVITWNSTGENPKKADELKCAGDADIYLIQEARQSSDGDIFKYLQSMGLKVTHCTEFISSGRGYICAVKPPIEFIDDFKLLDSRTAIRSPASVGLKIDKNTIRLITWHAPLDIIPSLLLPGASLEGGAPIIAFIEFEKLLPSFTEDIIIIAGDLNSTPKALSTKYSGYRILDTFSGVSNHLDHIISKSHIPMKYSDSFYMPTSSTHALLSTVITW